METRYCEVSSLVQFIGRGRPARAGRERLYRALMGTIGGILAGLANAACFAQTTPASSWRVTIELGQWAHENLVDLPVKGLTQQVRWRDQFLAAGGVSRVILPALGVPLPGLQTARLEFETRLASHFGLMVHPEMTAAFVLRSRDFNPWGGLRLNVAVGEGLSYAFQTPDLEGVRRQRSTQKLLNYLTFEAEIGHAAIPGVTLVPKLHHRSGVYGLIGPSGDGSNYVGVGVRFDLP